MSILSTRRKVSKVLRFIIIYGFGKTLYKVIGRNRNFSLYRPKKYKIQDVAVIGCGQFSFSTLGHALSKKFGNRFADCFDIDEQQQKTFADFYDLDHDSHSIEIFWKNDKIHFVYVTSNHNSHTDYAIEAIKRKKTVYIEKPISVSDYQLSGLLSAVRKYKPDIYAGYNRPFSAAVRDLKLIMASDSNPFSISCFVSGHKIEENHWYRNPKEGTRICGNVGHWLDLCVHLMSWKTLSDQWYISLTYSNIKSPDDDIAISLSSKSGDLLNIVITSRCEPFEGINETINIQCGNTIAKIDDFRRMTVWRDDKIKKFRYWPKDVGHNQALLQPFFGEKRDWHEVELSTVLMLFIKDMVLNGKTCAKFCFSNEFERITGMTIQNHKNVMNN